MPRPHYANQTTSHITPYRMDPLIGSKGVGAMHYKLSKNSTPEQDFAPSTSTQVGVFQFRLDNWSSVVITIPSATSLHSTISLAKLSGRYSACLLEHLREMMHIGKAAVHRNFGKGQRCSPQQFLAVLQSQLK